MLSFYNKRTQLQTFKFTSWQYPPLEQDIVDKEDSTLSKTHTTRGFDAYKRKFIGFGAYGPKFIK